MSLTVKGHKTQITTNYDTPIKLNFNENYEMALVGLEIYYSIPKIGATRNLIKWSSDSGSTWHEFKLPVGAYELADFIQKHMVKNGGERTSIQIQPNIVTLKAILTLLNGYQADFNVENSLRHILGFNARVYTVPYQESDNVVNILNINSIHVIVDLISGSYINGINKSIIYSFLPNVNPEHKVVEKPLKLDVFTTTRAIH